MNSLFRISVMLLTSIFMGCSSNRPARRWWSVGGVYVLAKDETLWIVIEKEQWKQRGAPLASPPSLIIQQRHVVFEIIGGKIVLKDAPLRDADLWLNPRLSTMFVLDDCLFAYKKVNSRLYCWEIGKGFQPIDATAYIDKSRDVLETPLSTAIFASSNISDFVESMDLISYYDGYKLPVVVNWGSRTIKLEVDSGNAECALNVNILVKHNDNGESMLGVD